MITRTCIKSRKPFLFRFRRWEILKRQNYAKNGLPTFCSVGIKCLTNEMAIA